MPGSGGASADTMVMWWKPGVIISPWTCLRSGAECELPDLSSVLFRRKNNLNLKK